jgi:two-component system, chemotaxis family, protein-glutamate methylesterase/glutaminase
MRHVPERQASFLPLRFPFCCYSQSNALASTERIQQLSINQSFKHRLSPARHPRFQRIVKKDRRNLAQRDIVVIGCSVGGVEALQQLVARLPKDFPASVFVVLHLSPQSTSVLPEILRRAGPLPALHPRDGEAIRTGRIYVAPPDNHLILENGHVRVTRGPKENRHRPAVDPLFRSAARWYGPRAIGVVLTGSLDDGTAGLLAIKKCGGIAIVQDPQEAFAPSMPQSALDIVSVDYVATVKEISGLLQQLVTVEVSSNGNGKSNGAGMASDLKKETQLAELDMHAIEDENRPGVPSPFGCPECGGVLWELNEKEMLRFRCRVGHAYTAGSLSVEQSVDVEGALWAAMRALEEGASLARRMAEKAARGNHPHLEDRYRDRAHAKKEQAEILRKLILESQDAPIEMEKTAS